MQPGNSIDDVDMELSETELNVGLASAELSESRRRLLDLVMKLLNTGVQEDIDIPQIAVVGSQSAGKSSLIEAIAGITLPRAAGTCTRCPTECKLTCSTSPWSCLVSLRFTKSVNGEALGEPKTIVFGSAITKKSEVEERIRRAQRAILNPSTNFKQFLDGDDEDPAKHETRFSSNCVSLQISGPGIANVSFCDLPGLIASVSGGDSGDIELVKGLVTSYICRPSCIILLTVACEVDFEVQGAHHLVKEYDPHGQRTIGVLTKPDRIAAGDEQRWVSFVRNKEEPLEHGWFCVKQPGSTELKKGITWIEARQKENEFFSMTAPWNEMEGVYQKHLRTSNLIERASSVLSNLIAKRLPKIQDELQKSIREAQQNLSALPSEPSSDPLGEIIRLLYGFTQDISRHIAGLPHAASLPQTLRPHQHFFSAAIRATAPDFRVHKRPPSDTHPGEAPKLAFLNDENNPIEVPDDSRFAEFLRGRVPVFIDEVMRRAHEARTRELPDNYPFVVRSNFISEVTDQWQEPARVLCDIAYQTLNDFARHIIHDHFGAFGQGHLEQRVRVIVQDHLEKCRAAAETRIDWLIALEQRPFTLNTHYLTSYKDKFLSHYKAARQAKTDSALLETINNYRPSQTQASTRNKNYEHVEPSGVARVLLGLTEIGFNGVRAADLPKLLPVDELEPALNIMAEVRAYFQVAYKRFADTIPLAIDRELVFGLERNLSQILQAGLGITGPNGQRICQELVEERPEVAEQRKELRKKLERLNAARRELLETQL
ncbi:hypothetical protein HGRIS_000424 [Hohenbuehelia grisea]|uniref:P-loop containing nucleoside triphosphate hydrolase protein n=1 Tax=Hohenbuehelia grisea TaxID=104357 RepID=A0ABR3JR64_9AGAR